MCSTDAAVEAIERQMAADRTLTYLTDRELKALRKRDIVKVYRWSWRNQLHAVTVTFHMASAAYIDVSYDGQVIDCINVWDYAKGVPKVRTREDFRRACASYWADDGTVRDMIRGGLGLPMSQR